MTDSTRFKVRQTASGWVVFDSEDRTIRSTHASEAAAKRACRATADETSADRRTYAVTWYVEVDAANEAEATERARKYLAPAYRDGWDPHSVEHVE